MAYGIVYVVFYVWLEPSHLAMTYIR